MKSIYKLLLIFLFTLSLNCEKSLKDTHCREEGIIKYYLNTGDIKDEWETKEDDFRVDNFDELYKFKSTCEKNSNKTYKGGENGYNNFIEQKNKIIYLMGDKLKIEPKYELKTKEPKSLEKCDFWNYGPKYFLSFEEKTLIEWEVSYTPKSCDCDAEIRWGGSKCGDGGYQDE